MHDYSNFLITWLCFDKFFFSGKKTQLNYCHVKITEEICELQYVLLMECFSQ